MLGKTVQSSKKQAPSYTVTGRSKIGSFHEDLQKVKFNFFWVKKNLNYLYKIFSLLNKLS